MHFAALKTAVLRFIASTASEHGTLEEMNVPFLQHCQCEISPSMFFFPPGLKRSQIIKGKPFLFLGLHWLLFFTPRASSSGSLISLEQCDSVRIAKLIAGT